MPPWQGEISRQISLQKDPTSLEEAPLVRGLSLKNHKEASNSQEMQGLQKKPVWAFQR
jgi:hypothetical protein